MKMEKELSLREIFYEVILFFIAFRKIILLTTILGTSAIVLFQKVRPAYYNTTAIVTSGISIFERLNDESTLVLDQKVAIDLVNLLQLDVKKQDYLILSEKMKISLKDASVIKSIRAEEITTKDSDKKEFNTPKFSIHLSVKDNTSISNIQEGLQDYFTTNMYVKGYYSQFVSTTLNEINEIDNEVKSLRAMRESDKSAIDVSSVNISSTKSEYDVNNQILELIRLRSKNSTDLASLKPLSFVAPFTKTQNPERGVLMIGAVAAGISFLLGIIISIFKNVYIKSKE